jgi:hypothetical protein
VLWYVVLKPLRARWSSDRRTSLTELSTHPRDYSRRRRGSTSRPLWCGSTLIGVVPTVARIARPPSDVVRSRQGSQRGRLIARDRLARRADDAPKQRRHATASGAKVTSRDSSVAAVWSSATTSDYWPTSTQQSPASVSDSARLRQQLRRVAHRVQRGTASVRCTRPSAPPRNTWAVVELLARTVDPSGRSVTFPISQSDTATGVSRITKV